MSGRLRILHAVCSQSFAGVERFVYRLALAQANSGHEVAVVGGAPEHMRAPLEAAGVRYRPARSVQEVARFVRGSGGRVDVVNTHMTAADIGAVVGATLMRARPALIATRHFARPRGTIGPPFAYRLLERRIDAEIAISRAVAETIGVPSTVVHSGVDLTHTGAGHRSGRVVLMAQRLQPEKRTDIGIRAFAASRLHMEGWKLHIAGEGSERDQLVPLARRLGVESAVRFLGFRNDVPALMESSDILLAPCPREGLGLTVLEAMALGLPAVAADACGHTELLERLDPRALFPADQFDAAAANLRALAEDSVGRVALGRALQERQRHEFSVDGQVAGTEVVYRRALGDRRQGAR